MRVIEDNTSGELLQAADDRELLRVLREHEQQMRPHEPVDEDVLRERIAREAYDAMDS